MKLKDAFTEMLNSTTKIIEYAVNTIPGERFNTPPPHGSHPNVDEFFKTYFGIWSAARLLFHLAHYEHHTTVPTMNYWLGRAGLKCSEFELLEPEGKAWDDVVLNGIDRVFILRQFKSIRMEQIRIISKIPEVDFHRVLKTDVFGEIPFLFVVSKTIQHSLEHGNDLMKNAVHWDRILVWLDQSS